MNSVYQTPAVRQRMIEFLGGASLEEVTAVYIAGEDAEEEIHYLPQPVHELNTFLEKGFDIARSLWDRGGLLVDLDLDYLNYDFPAEPFLKPHRIVTMLEAMLEGIDEELRRLRITSLRQLSGSGAHYAWYVSENSLAFDRLVALGHLPDTLRNIYQQPQPPAGEPVGLRRGAAFAGLALVMEYLAATIHEHCHAELPLPLQLTAVPTEEKHCGREMFSLDISEYGDPLHLRTIRVPFSCYLKPHQQAACLGPEIVRGLPRLYCLPLEEHSPQEVIAIMRDETKVQELAQQTTCYIPNGDEAMLDLIAAYEHSPLARFHVDFYSQKHDPPEAWPTGYDALDPDTLSPVCRDMLRHPNDALLTPAGLRYLTHELVERGWHPRHVAGLVRSKFERDYGWGDMWYRYDAATRADFYVRLFAGRQALGDKLEAAIPVPEGEQNED